MKTILVDAFNTFVIKDHGIFEEMYEMLEQYPNRKIILTNANEEQMAALGLVDLPYELFTLQHEPEKTDPEYFKIMLDHFGLSKDDVIYFEHNEDAVRSAQSVGIKTYHYDKDKKNLQALKNFLEQNFMLENYKAFLDKIFSNMKTAGFNDDEFIVIDHVAFRTETIKRYEELKSEFEKMSSNSSEAIISERPIMVYRLREPLIYGEWKVEGLELCAPKEGSFFKEGLEHAEFVTKKSLEDFMHDHENVNFDMKAYLKEENPELILEFEGCAVKFHTQSLLEIRKL